MKIEQIKSAPVQLQIAKDGKWEECWMIELDRLPSQVDIEGYLTKEKYTDLAIEIVWEGHYILGVEYAPHLLVTPAVFLERIMVDAQRCTDFGELIGELNTALTGQEFLLTGEPDLIRVGVVNHWFSVGPMQVWRKGEAKTMTMQQLEQIISTKPEVESTKLNYQGMSFIFNLESTPPGTCHWIKSPCSKQENGVWKLDRTMIAKYLQEWAEFEIGNSH